MFMASISSALHLSAGHQFFAEKVVNSLLAARVGYMKVTLQSSIALQIFRFQGAMVRDMS